MQTNLNTVTESTPPPIPYYLEETYHWAYLAPLAVRIFEHEWIVNLILWGNLRKLQDAAIEEIAEPKNSRCVQIACVYGSLSRRLAEFLHTVNSKLDVVDVAPVQLESLHRKTKGCTNITSHQMDSNDLKFANQSFSNSLLFFLMHEQPEHARRKSIEEAIRVTKKGGKLTIIDFHNPKLWNPFRYSTYIILKLFEPYALDMWRNDMETYFPEDFKPKSIKKTLYFGNLYQKVVIEK